MPKRPKHVVKEGGGPETAKKNYPRGVLPNSEPKCSTDIAQRLEPETRPSATGAIPFCLPLFTSPTRPMGGDPYSTGSR